MILQFHYRGVGEVEMQFPVVPAVGHYLRHAGALWVVDAVVLGEPIDVYVVRVGDPRASELTAAWAAWAQPVAVEEAKP